MYKVHCVYRISAIELSYQIEFRDIAKYLSQGGYEQLSKMVGEYEDDLENNEDLEAPEYDMEIVVKEVNGLTSYFLRFEGITLYFKNVEQDDHLVEYCVQDWLYEILCDNDLYEDYQDRQEVLEIMSELPEDF